MKKILFICESYFEKASPNGVCVQEVAECLAKRGHKVSVVTFFNALNQNKYSLINGVEVYRVNPGYIETKLYENENDEKKRKSILKLSRINGALHAFKYPLLSRKQVNNLYKKANQLCLEKGLDICVSVYHKIADVLAGIKLKQKHKELKLILYTLDSISGGYVPRILHSKKIPTNSLYRWEKYFFKNVDSIFAMNSHREYYNQEKYSAFVSKMEFLDIPLLKVRNVTNNSGNKAIFTGSLFPSGADPRYLLKIIGALNLEVHFYGYIDPEIEKEILMNEELNKKVFIEGTISHEQALKVQNEANILINFGNANPNMIPCKIFEYISANKKILSFTHSVIDSSLPYLLKYENGIIIDENEENDSKNIKVINEFVQREFKPITKENLQQEFKENSPEYFCDKLEKI